MKGGEEAQRRLQEGLWDQTRAGTSAGGGDQSLEGGDWLRQQNSFHRCFLHLAPLRSLESSGCRESSDGVRQVRDADSPQTTGTETELFSPLSECPAPQCLCAKAAVLLPLSESIPDPKPAQLNRATSIFH